MGIECTHKIGVSSALPVVLMPNTVCSCAQHNQMCSNGELVFETAFAWESPYGPNRELNALLMLFGAHTKMKNCILTCFPMQRAAGTRSNSVRCIIIMPISNLLLFTLLVGITTFVQLYLLFTLVAIECRSSIDRSGYTWFRWHIVSHSIPYQKKKTCTAGYWIHSMRTMNKYN